VARRRRPAIAQFWGPKSQATTTRTRPITIAVEAISASSVVAIDHTASAVGFAEPWLVRTSTMWLPTMRRSATRATRPAANTGRDYV
jgi:hypothetical protein